ncbi:ATP-binding protein [Ramlibacter sp.]|uniref:sensor histidine kinase n=1 Tax=Ramlibacter sp. TaxID=1917967 RepID=UPI0017E96231|nr:ATP-binding protein [Ramlibacter sp.]MBA2676346.1 PAS domain-containing protein [Ramlibacter sp.]
MVSAPVAEVPEDSAFHRLWRGFMTARVTIALVLTVVFAVLYVLGGPHTVNGWMIGLCATYLTAALAVRTLTQPAPPGNAFDPQWVSTIGVDLMAFSTLQFLQAAGLNYLPLFALPVLTAGVLGSPLLALGTAAGVTLLLLGDAWIWALQQGIDASRFLQAGLTGIGYFAIALLANQLAARLSREERAARRGRMAARVQAQVNELVIENLGDGVLVVSAEQHVHTANPAARHLLGDGTPAAAPFALNGRTAWHPLAQLVRRTFLDKQPQTAEVALARAGGERQLVHVRTRLTPPHDPQSEGLCVMFLQDLREMEARLRTEKLAAMGRMSAAVAHEIRNPLAAIAQANALLEEDLTDAGQRRLSALVGQNAQRLARIVDEILNIARVQQQGTPPAWLALDAAVATACEEWTRHTPAVAGRLHLVLAAPGARVAFEADHLRRVLVNLLDNALRYAGAAGDSICVETSALHGRADLRVWSDGEPLEQGVQRHLFEPFFSSESRSSGLGLYICRELCERHGASIGYRRAARGDSDGAPEGNDFFIHFRVPPAVAPAPPFDTIGA